MSTKMIAILALLVAPMIACSANVSFEQDANFNYLTITMTEQQVADIVTDLLQGGDSQLSNVGVDLRPGEIFVRGIITQDNGQQVPGSFGIRVWADGNLRAQISSFDYGALTMDQAGLSDFNRRLTEGLNRAAARDDSPSDITNVTITGSNLSFTIRSPRPER